MGKFKDIECMRVITMILVVFAHTTRMYTPSAAIPQIINDKLIDALTGLIYTFHMPAFVAISGAVYYFVKRERNGYTNTLAFIEKKAKRLLVPYAFFAIVVVIPTLWYCHLIKGNFWQYNFNAFILVNEARHLWYLIMLFILLIVFNSFERYIFKYKKIFLLLTLLIHPLAYSFPIKIFQISSVIFYSLYFMLGYYFQYKRIEIINFLRKTNKLLISIILAILIIIIYSLHHGGLDFIPASLPCSILGIVFLYIVSLGISQNEKIINNTLFKLIDKNNFGLYLFHPMIIYIMFYSIKDSHIHPWISILSIFILSTAISIILTKFMRVIGLKIFIGEN